MTGLRVTESRNPRLPSTAMIDPTNEYFVVKDDKVIKISQDFAGRWLDAEFNVYTPVVATNNFVAVSVDPIDRCGIGIFSLPTDSPHTPACAVHDAQYSDITYQAFHTRKEADDQLYKNLRAGGASKLTAYTMWAISRVFGRFFWENKHTNV